MKVLSSLSFYHIPKFLKNDSDKDQKSTFIANQRNAHF
ncbi:hypothetical protein C4K12_5756 [Pseudomonas chlororaphis subsp. aureofaciens]|nr:hypothetical protein C4K12_0129 [Pseudomonas chlororaphis subsp. aureofaciens]AZD96645.1 hypothetical protein C4K12_0755 [Pseudomonas chlororaphis subsp. aureofaciens]AZE01240.1 hypothetical protein C4K12_5401 [Pseudomonas chlororaphis subsp. aureofaciens]AZE01582.1 hypothetical protein C4K12_5756 [Pseudomonas chlororaphis subsp. aureofaciens]